MKSIRHYLWLRLMLGLNCLWLVAGVGLFFVVRYSLQAKFDAELDLLASEVRFLIPEARYFQPTEERSRRTVEFFVANSGYYFEIWGPDALFSDRSPSLGQMGLPRPDAFRREPVYWNAVLPSGEAVRLTAVRMSIPLRGGGRGPGSPPHFLEVDIVVARNCAELGRGQSLVVGGMTVVILLTSLVCAAIVGVSVKGALRPVRRLGEEANAIGPERMDARFSSEGTPVELLPIMERLNDLMGRLDAAFERERRFSADLAHELRTPLAELKTMVACAMKWPDDPEPTLLEDVQQSVAQMQGVLESLLALTRLERGGAGEGGEPVRIAELIGHVWAPLVERARERELTFETDVPDDLTITSSVDLMRVIVSNLLANAVSYATPGSCIRAQGVRCGAEGMALTVSNAVSGLTQADVDQMFERLWRKDAARTARENHGLGLSLARSSAHALGYRLDAELTPDGAHLRMRLAPDA